MKLPGFVKKNKIFFIVIGILIPLELFAFLFFGNGVTWIRQTFLRAPNPISPTGILLFEGENCAQCDKVNTFIKNNNIESKITFTRLEVFNNTHNQDILADKSQICGLNPKQIGVPFLWDETNCIIGYVDVIAFFKDKMTVKKP